MPTDKPSWMTAQAIHLPESTSDMFIYHPVDDHDATWLTVVVDYECCPLKLELFTPDDGPLGLRLTARSYDHQMRLDEGSSIDLSFDNPVQRAAFFRMILELADWIKEHHDEDLPTV